MKLVYCAYSILDQIEPPDWLGKLAANKTVVNQGWGLYDPALGFMANSQNPAVAAALSHDRKIPHKIAEAHEVLRLDPKLFAPLGDVAARMSAADRFPSIDVSFKHLYVLLRSDVVLVDLTVPSHGGKYYEALYGHLFGKPVIGISHRFILSPWVAQRCDALVFPKNTDEIVRQVLAFDARIDGMIEEPDAVKSPD